MGFAPFHARFPARWLLPTSAAGHSHSQVTRAHALRSFPLISSRNPSPNRFAFWPLTAPFFPFLRKGPVLRAQPRLQGVAPLTSPCCVNALLRLTQSVLPWVSCPLQGFPDSSVGPPASSDGLLPHFRSAKQAQRRTLVALNDAAQGIVSLSDPLLACSLSHRNASSCCPQVCSGVPVVALTASPLLRSCRGRFACASDAIRVFLLGVVRRQRSIRGLIPRSNTRLPGCRMNLLQNACQLSRFMISAS